MTNIEKFHDTVGILVQAYIDNTLRHLECSYCAVGNIVHAAGWPRRDEVNNLGVSCGAWKWCFYTNQDGDTQINPFGQSYFDVGLRVIETTGYQWQDLMKVEKAFESVTGLTKDDKMFAGLMAVVDVLAEIHGIDLTVKESAKLQFIKP